MISAVSNYAAQQAVQGTAQKAAQQVADTDLLGTNSAQDASTMFLTLLTAQLKAQDPTSPMDPNQMVGQLVQFNTLGQIMKIRELLQAQTATTGGK